MNKVTSQRNFRKIAAIINSILTKKTEVDSKGRQISVHYTIVNNYLKGYF